MHHLSLLLLLCAVLSGCYGVKPSPPPAVLPGVEVGGTPIIQLEPVAPTVKKPPAQPLRNVYFAFDVDTLRPGQVRQLARLAKWAESQGKRLDCVGYADTVGASEYNEALSMRRAKAVAAILPCEAGAWGETTTWGANAKNRRVTLEAR